MPNGNQRGSSYDRARRKAWLLSPEAGWGGDGETVPCWTCGVLCGPDDVELIADRIVPFANGGAYRRDNIAPHCDTCSHRQGYFMMLEAAQVTSNADDKLIRIARVADDVSRTSVERMEVILRIAQEYDRGTGDHVARKRYRDAPEFRR